MGNKSIRVTGEGAPLLYLLLTVSYMVGIYWLSSISGKVDPESPLLSGIIAWTPPALQNLLHVPLFGLLAWLWYRTFAAWHVHHVPALTAAFVLTTCFGVFDEWHQLHVPGRYASLTDIVLNTAGVLLVLWRVHHGNRRRTYRESGDHTTV